MVEIWWHEWNAGWTDRETEETDYFTIYAPVKMNLITDKDCTSTQSSTHEKTLS